MSRSGSKTKLKGKAAKKDSITVEPEVSHGDTVLIASHKHT